MKNLITILVFAIALPIYGQGSFSLEFENPSGLDLVSLAKFENNNVYEIVLINNSTHTYKVYDGSSHTLKYSIQTDTSESLFFPNFVEFPSAQYMDFNNDGIFDFLRFNRYPHSKVWFKSGTDGAIITEFNYPPNMTGSSLVLLDIDDDDFLELILWNWENNKINIFSTTFHTVGIANSNTSVQDYELKQNYPNPFNPSTTIEYNLNKNAVVAMKIYDIACREIKTISKGMQTHGKYRIYLTTENLSSGTYFYQLIVDGIPETKKMVLVR